MPEDFYKVGPADKRQLDDLGLRALAHDWAVWLVEPSNDLMRRSQFNLFYDIGMRLFGRNPGQAREYAMYFIEKRQPFTTIFRPPDPQRVLAFGIHVEETRTGVPS
jgi:hypothetical protein